MGQCPACLSETQSSKKGIKVVPHVASKQQGVEELKKNYNLENNVKILGTGHFGKLLLTNSIFNKDQMVAIKVLDKIKLQEEESIDSVISEIEILNKLDHKCIVKYLEMYNDSSNLYFVMEYIEGTSIIKHFETLKTKNVFKTKSQFERKLCKYFKEMLEAIAHCHALNVIHRDIQAEKIIITKKDKVKVIGFGLSRQAASVAGYQGTSVVTYLAPEILTGKQYDSKVDIWAFGILMHILMTDKVPYYIKGKGVQPDFQDSKISYLGQSICRQMLTFEPNERPNAKKLLKDPWFSSFTEEEGPISDQEKKKRLQQAEQVVQRLKNYQGGTQFKRAALIHLVKISSEKELEKCTVAFQQIDYDNTGIIDASELKFYIEKFQLGLTDRQILDLIKELDYNGDGQINYTEFLAATVDYEKLITEDKLRSVFSVFDTESKGVISVQNMIFAFNKLGISMTLIQVQAIMEFHGVKPKENMSYEVFKKMIAPNYVSEVDAQNNVEAENAKSV